jgi:hypothetical protein
MRSINFTDKTCRRIQMNTTKNSPLFVEITSEEAAVINGGREASSGGGRKKRGGGADNGPNHH